MSNVDLVFCEATPTCPVNRAELTYMGHPIWIFYSHEAVQGFVRYSRPEIMKSLSPRAQKEFSPACMQGLLTCAYSFATQRQEHLRLERRFSPHDSIRFALLHANESTVGEIIAAEFSIQTSVNEDCPGKVLGYDPTRNAVFIAESHQHLIDPPCIHFEPSTSLRLLQSLGPNLRNFD